MSSPLEIVNRKLGSEYTRIDKPLLGGWNPDANEAAMPQQDFSELKNLRIQRPGELELRTGYRLFETELDNSHQVLLTKAGYTFGVDTATPTDFDVTLYSVGVGSLLRACFMTLSGSTPTYHYVTIIATGIAQDVPVDAVQFNGFLIVTVYGHGIYAVNPTDGTFATWQVLQLGQDICPGPSVRRYLDNTTGDLFALDASRQPTGEGNMPTTSNWLWYDPGEKNPRYIRLDLNAEYFPATSVPTIAYPDHVRGIIDMGASDGSNFSHTETRGWGYRFVLVQEFTDGAGQTFKYRSHPSADFWVKDRYYSPAQLLTNPLGTIPWGASGSGALGNFTSWLFNENNVPPGSAAFYFGTAGGSFFPNRATFERLKDAYRSYIHSGTNGGHSIPFYFLAWYFGWRESDNTLTGKPMEGVIMDRDPYLEYVPASLLKDAPLTVFEWDDFGLTLPSNTISIEIYRTAYGQPDDKDNPTKSPDFDQYDFRYVGTLTPDATFTDDITDANRLSTKALDFDAYPKGYLSGQVIGVYNKELVLGNLETKYSVLEPEIIQSAFFSDHDPFVLQSTVGYTKAEIADTFRFYLAYEDKDGNHSTARLIQSSLIANDDLGPSAPLFWLYLTLPRGYNPEIVNAIIYRDNFFSSTHHYSKIATIPLKSGYYISKNDEVEVAVTADDLNANIETQHYPGAIGRSTNQMFFWPPTNFELRHQFAPVMGFRVITGPLWIFTDRDVTLTELNGKAEMENEFVGLIGRRLIAKVDKHVFFLASSGLYYAAADGIVAFPAQVNTVVQQYLQETIDGHPALANASRGSLGWHSNRNELWLYFPSSVDLGGTLPHKLIIYKFVGSNSPRSLCLNYEFDLTETFELTETLGLDGVGVPDVDSYHSWPVLFQAHSKGQFYASYFDVANDNMLTLDCDAINYQWPGSTTLETIEPLGKPNTFKELRSFLMKLVLKAQIKFCTGQPKYGGVSDLEHGHVHALARIFDGTTFFLQNGSIETKEHTVSGSSIEKISRSPIIRIRTWPRSDTGEHVVVYKALDIFASLVHNHPD